MTRIKLELTATDDRVAVRMITTLRMMLVEDGVRAKHRHYTDRTYLKPGYSLSDLDGSCVCDVTREDNGIERGMEVTL